MSLKNISKVNILLLLILSINGCVAPGGDECKYDTFKTYAVVKKIKENHVILDISTKVLPYSWHEKSMHKEIILRLPSVHIGERIPIYVDQITKGACTPIGYRVDKDYFRIKGECKII